MSLIRGVDISRYQQVTSWSKLKGAAGFVVVKATEGTSYTSQTWRSYFAAARKAGVLAGSYHFGRPPHSPTAEASYYVKALRSVGWRTGFDLPPVLDIEDSGGLSRRALTDWALTFCREVDKQLGLTQPWLRCGFYSNRDFYHSRLDGPAVHNGRWWWAAVWSSPSGPWPSAEKDKPAGAAIWQWSGDKQGIAGIVGKADLDVARSVDLHSLAPIFYGKASAKHTEELDPLAQITLKQIEGVVVDAVKDATTVPVSEATRKTYGYAKGAYRLTSIALDASWRIRALTTIVQTMAKSMGPTVEHAVAEQLERLLDGDVDVSIALTRADPADQSDDQSST